MFKRMGFPEKKGLYDPSFEKDACGFGFIADINNEPKHEIVHQALDIVHKLDLVPRDEFEVLKKLVEKQDLKIKKLFKTKKVKKS